MKALARRAFLRFAGTAAAAMPMAAKAVVNGQMAQQTGGALGSALAAAPTPVSLGDYPAELTALETISNRRGEQAQTLLAYRDGHFDADIAALRSLPHATKVRMQTARDEAFKEANRTLWKQIQEWRDRLYGPNALQQAASAIRRSVLS